MVILVYVGNVSNKGNIFINDKAKIYTKDIFRNDGTLMEDVKIRKNFGYGDETTKGISQIDYFSNEGVGVKILGFAKDLGTYVDLFNFARFVQAGGPSTSESLPLNLGPLTPLWDLAGVLVADMKSDIEDQFSDLQKKKFDAIKLQGWVTVRKYINSTKHMPEYQKEPYDIMEVSAVTANKLLQGEFKTFEDFYQERFLEMDLESSESNTMNVLFREVQDKNRKGYSNYIIETIFINE